MGSELSCGIKDIATIIGDDYRNDVTPIVNLFIYFNKITLSPHEDISIDFIDLIEESWKISPIDTLRIIFYFRDNREGKGHKFFYKSSIFFNLLLKHRQAIEQNFMHIPYYGSWKDLLVIFCGSDFEDKMIEFYTEKLKENIEYLNANRFDLVDVFIAKYAPTEKCKYDKKYDLVSKFIKKMGVTKEEYRKNYIRPLRNFSPCVERLMCENKWDYIDFSKVPYMAFNRYRSSFKKHSPKKFEEYLKNIKSRNHDFESKLETFDIIDRYTDKLFFERNNTKKIDEVETRWSTFLESHRHNQKSCIPIIDISGSMFGKMGSIAYSPLTLALGVGLYASLSDEHSPFYKKWITFSSKPTIENIKEDSLHKILNNIDYDDWNYTLGLIEAFHLVLDYSILNKVSPTTLPKYLLIITDSSFDNCINVFYENDLNMVEKRYKENGYIRPFLVFWKIGPLTKNIPSLRDGISRSIFIEGCDVLSIEKVLNGEEVSQYSFIRDVIDSERYSKISY